MDALSSIDGSVAVFEELMVAVMLSQATRTEHRALGEHLPQTLLRSL